ncbi:MAG: bifunctional riboflavin kinase/FAD synthetase [Desulfonatronovibrionaceae bacterium]
MIIHDFQQLAGRIDSSCLTIGNFDGVHIGHQQLIMKVKKRARLTGMASMVVTFDPHPMRVLVDKKTPPFITLTGQKLRLIDAMGVDYTLCIHFNMQLASLEPEEFVRDILVKGLKVRELIIGYDYAFGKGRRGNFNLLRDLGRVYGFAVDRFPPVMVGGAIVSSTRIRDLLEEGRVWDARPLLGRFFNAEGKVVTGQRRGAALLGFPTANILLKDELFPKTGVYAVWIEVKGRVWAGVANIGYNPTFGNEYLSVEVHIFDFSQDIYGEKATVHFVQRLRSEKKFSGIDELKSQIEKDCLLARKILSAPEALLG